LRSEERVVPAGEAAMFSGSDLRLKFGFVSHLARNRAELATALRLPPGGIDEDPTLGQGRRGIRVDVRGPIRADVTTWIERSLREAVERDQVNLICLVIDSPGGSPADSVRLAQYLAGLDASRVRTLAYVAHEARADAALIALACHQLVLGQDAVLGGPGAERVRGQRLEDLRVILRDMARTSGKNWSLPLAMLDRDLEVRRYTREGTGEVRYFCAEELSEQPDADRWKAGPLLRTSAGLRGPEAVEAGLARTVAEDFPEFQRLYQFEETLPSLRPTWAHRLIEFLAKPQVAGTLLFIGFFALMIETMSPGIGLPGFISAVSFLLFFWANFLHGTAGWLEILLFAAGLGCLALEIFVLPGFGVFGVGGILLVMASIVLASQTFVIPRNAYEWNQLPTSLYMLVAAGTGGFASLILVRKFVSRAPLFRRVALETPDGQSLERLRYQEALVHFDHLLGKRGVAATQLTPCGKAQFGDDVVDVISDGDLIPRGSDIVVTEIRGNEIVVKALEV
jgi:membrane-bound ClpP family serine protease